jgi:hypothetical protein
MAPLHSQTQRRPAVTPVPGEDVPGRLPDLTTETPEEIYIEQQADGRKLQRFDTRVMNIGEGPIELVGEWSDAGESAFATQRIHREEGTLDEYDAGELSYSDQHGHWHLNDFALFELRPRFSEDRESESVASQNKITFCLLDEVRIRPLGEHMADDATYLTCDWRFQGISAGWSETYVAALPEQWVDVTDVEDGDYALHVMLDPDDKLIESDDDNNAVALEIEIRGDEVRRLDERENWWPSPPRPGLPRVR